MDCRRELLHKARLRNKRSMDLSDVLDDSTNTCKFAQIFKCVSALGDPK